MSELPAAAVGGRGDEARVVAAFCAWLAGEGWTSIRTEVEFCDVVAQRDGQILYAEAKGHTSEPGTDSDVLYGQLLRRMPLLDDPTARFAVVVPTPVVRHVLRVPARLRAVLHIDVYVVDDIGGVELVEDSVSPEPARRGWSVEQLTGQGFCGWVTFADLPAAAIPDVAGVYLVAHPVPETVEFLASTSAAFRGGRDPVVPVERLRERWVAGTPVLYIGKAAGREGLRQRLLEYRRHGLDNRAGHWGGRYIWQLADPGQLLVAWRPAASGRDAEDVESELLADFVADHGRLPFANLKKGRAPSS
ncbi:hypothetical protein [Actinotalea sp. K2]|uniref:hypothetical protein n=1 Tax=Actinotalea sp. K2 TaxID=2939438 RepID=UPI0020175013|nr:hypothetical protein [Actinotalea sp. K2]MCL3862950.1 hypothetical protein [Actinotalea sp. K2]